MVEPPPFEEPDSRNIIPPDDVDAICPTHGYVATITLEKYDGAYIVSCGKCGKQCELRAHESRVRHR